MRSQADKEWERSHRPPFRARVKAFVRSDTFYLIVMGGALVLILLAMLTFKRTVEIRRWWE